MDESHPLELGIEEINLSQSQFQSHKTTLFYNQLNRDVSIEEIDLSKSRSTADSKPKLPEKPPKPSKGHVLFMNKASSHSNNSTSSTAESPTSPTVKSKPLKRIAPRILPKIPKLLGNLQKSQASNVHTNTETTKPEINLNTNREHNFYVQTEQVGWYYKKDVQADSSKNESSSANNNNNNNNINVVYRTQNSIQNNLDDDDGSQSANTTTDSTNSNNPSNNKKWILFNKTDTAKLEAKYRALIINPNEASKSVTVLGDIYEVNLVTRKCYSIYWKIKRTYSVMRSVWFNEAGEPFEEKASDEIEAKHIELFGDVIDKTNEMEGSINSGDLEISSPTEEMKKNGIDHKSMSEPVGSVNIEEGVVTWYSKDEVCWEKNKMSLIEKMNFGISKFRSKMSGMKIKRGLKVKTPKSSENDSADNEEKEQEITHLVFVIHGIAQKMYENGIVKNCDDLRKECDRKKKEFFPNHKNQRYMFLPVDWRSSLTLDDGVVETITPSSIQFIREKLNSSGLDVMYYTSPLFRIEILNSLSSELNRLYNLFCEKNPYFKLKYQKVSFVAHSLGTVIIYDILTSDNSCTQFSNTYGQLTNQEREKFHRYSQNDTALLNEYLQCKNRIQEIESNLMESNNNIKPLGFQVENFFCLGSPLSVFLAMRGVRPAGTANQEHILPRHLCKNLYNIFHPSDPIAYRIEPLIIKHYSTKSPIEIIKSDTAPKYLVSYKDLNERRSAFDTVISNPNRNLSKNRHKLDKELDETIGYNSSGVYTYNTSNSHIDPVELENALDYQLQDSNFELMATLRAHTCYWKSPDIGLFIMTQLCVNDST